MKTIILLVGVPASGKSYVAAKLSHRLAYIANDDFIGKDYLGAICERAKHSDGPFLAEATFSISKIRDPLEREGYRVVPVFIIEDEDVLHSRWDERGTAWSTRKGHLTRQKTYLERAMASRSFGGTSEEVAKWLEDEI